MTRAGDHRVFVSRRIPEPGLGILRRHCRVRLWPERLPPSPAQLREGISDVDGVLTLLTDRMDGEMMDAASDLRVISNYAVGYDNVDVRAATERGIAVTNTPGVLTEATADFTFALLMAAARRVVEGDGALRRGEWLTWEPAFLLGRDVHGATLGIVGLGRIGRALARRAAGFGMRLLYFDIERNPEAEAALGLEYAPLDELLGTSDFISLHVPLNENTHRMLGRRELQMTREGAILVNTSRGEVIAEDALVEALRDGPLAAAGLDVYGKEPLPVEHPLVRLDNAVLCPHLGSASVGARRAMARVAAENLVGVLEGAAVEHVVNPEVLRGQGEGPLYRNR